MSGNFSRLKNLPPEFSVLNTEHDYRKTHVTAIKTFHSNKLSIFRVSVKVWSYVHWASILYSHILHLAFCILQVTSTHGSVAKKLNCRVNISFVLSKHHSCLLLGQYVDPTSVDRASQRLSCYPGWCFNCEFTAH